jgi:hypothetical protein
MAAITPELDRHQPNCDVPFVIDVPDEQGWLASEA